MDPVIANKCICGSAANSGINCATCGIVYHASCIQRAPITCCNNAITVQVSDAEIDYRQETFYCMRDLILELKSSNALLRDKISALETENQGLKRSLNRVSTKNPPRGKTASAPSSGPNTDVQVSAAQGNSSPNGLVTACKYPTSGNAAAALPQEDGQQVVSKSNYAPEITCAPTVSAPGSDDTHNSAGNEEAEYTQVKRRRGRRTPTAGLIKGTAPNADNVKFTGQPKRYWLFLGKVNRDVVEDDIKSYIFNSAKSNAPNINEADIEVLKLSGSSYRVGITEQIYNMTNDAKFWPSNVSVRRFNFHKAANNVNNVNENFRGTPAEAPAS